MNIGGQICWIALVKSTESAQVRTLENRDGMVTFGS